MTFGDVIKEKRKKAGLSMDQVAQELGVTRQVIFLYEHNKTTPKLHNAIKLANLFQINLNDVKMGK
jgi:DNA-binding XRE family transcriptional regulator